MTGDPNVLLVVLDSVRARNVGLYGYDRDTTPFLDRFADRCQVYHDAVAPGVWSLPSHVSMLTGLEVDQHRVWTMDDRLAPGHTIFEELSERGYETGVFSQNVWLTEIDTGIPDAFDATFGSENVTFPDALDPYKAEFDGYLDFLRMAVSHDHTARSLANGVLSKLQWDYPRLYSLLASDRTLAGAYLDRFLEWSADRERWAALVNLMDAHSPYRPAEEFDRWADERAWEIQDEIEDGVWEFLCEQRPWDHREALLPLYDGSIRQIDHHLEHLVRTLAGRGELEETLLIVTSDHGEGFGETTPLPPGWRAAGHAIGLHEVQTHVPLLVHHPGQDDRVDVESYASLTAIPELIRGTLAGERRHVASDRESPVVSSSLLAEAIKIARAREHCGSADRFRLKTMAVHEDDPRRRYVHRDGHEIVETDDGVREVEGESRVRPVFDGFEDAGVRERAGGSDELDDATERTLRELGYL